MRFLDANTFEIIKEINENVLKVLTNLLRNPKGLLNN